MITVDTKIKGIDFFFAPEKLKVHMWRKTIEGKRIQGRL